MMQKRKIRNLFTHRDLQLRIILNSLVYLFLVLLVTLIVTLSPFMYDMFLSQDMNVQYQAAQTFLLVFKRLAPALAGMFVLAFIHQAVITHRVCGPLVNFTNTFRRVAKGDLTQKVTLRKGDFLKNECRKINTMIEQFAQLVSRVKNDHEKLVLLLEDILKQAADVDTKKKIEKTLDIIRREALFVSEDLSRFTLDDTGTTSDKTDAAENG